MKIYRIKGKESIIRMWEDLDKLYERCLELQRGQVRLRINKEITNNKNRS